MKDFNFHPRHKVTKSITQHLSRHGNLLQAVVGHAGGGVTALFFVTSDLFNQVAYFGGGGLVGVVLFHVFEHHLGTLSDSSVSPI